MKKQNAQAGFTILELTIATAIFSVILIVIALGIIGFTTSYIKGVHASQTQEAARTSLAKITQSLQYATSFDTSAAVGGWKAYCFGNYKYSFQLNQPIKGTEHALIQSPLIAGAACTPVTTSSFSNGTDTELLKANMRLAETNGFEIKPIGSDSYQISIKIVYGDDDLINTSGRCKEGAGNQYCADSSLETVVHRRL